MSRDPSSGGGRRTDGDGRAELVARQLTLRFGPLGDDVRARLSAASIEGLDVIGERLLTAQSLQDALGSQEDQS